MNKRMKKKYLLAELQRANNLQQEVIEDYGNQLAEAKRELTELRAVVERTTLATNNRFDQLEAENKALWQEIEDLKHQLKPKLSFFNRK